jgi:glutaminase
MRSPVADYLEIVHRECRQIRDGEVATYIPELAKADPDWFGIVLATVDGHLYAIGDTEQPFTIQSVSKPFTYGAMLEAHGPVHVEEHVGVEPSGNAFNALLVDEVTQRPFNPMVNAGAIVTTGLALGYSDADRRDRLFSALGRFAGHELEMDDVVYQSERDTGHRNRALAHLMRSFDQLDDVDRALDLYFQQCALLVTCRDLAIMAATLANAGVNPMTHERVLGERNVERVLSVMSSCGMYDYAGEWDYKVGLPAKSGVSGGLIAVLPGQLGIGVFSPPLDRRGNTTRGIAVCERLSNDLQLHSKRARPRAGTAVRRRFSGADVRSSRVRPTAEQELLAERGCAVAAYELQGDLLFSSTEPINRALGEHLESIEYVILDFRRVGAVDQPAVRLLRSIADEILRSGRALLFSYVDPNDASLAMLTSAPGARCFDATDAALEWCEEQLLAGMPTVTTMSLRDQDLLQGLDEVELAAVERAVERRELVEGQLVIREGEAADAVYFLLEGSVSVRLRLDDSGRSRTIASFGPGVAFGEAALLDEQVRSADVQVEEPVIVAVLPVTTLGALAAEHTGLDTKLLTNVARVLAARLRAANGQIRALER